MSGILVNVISDTEVQNSLLQLRSLIKEDDMLKQFEFGELYLTRFLYSTDLQAPRALQKVQQYHTVMLTDPKWFAFTSPIDLKHVIELNHMGIIEGRDKNGRKIMVGKLGCVNVSRSSIESYFHLIIMFMEKIIDDPLTLEKGICAIIDVQGFPWKLFQWLTPYNIKIGIKLLENFPIKEQMFHVVNKSYLIQASLKLLWPFLSGHRKELIKFHFTDWTSLHQFINPAILPREYGGCGPDINIPECNEMLLEQSETIAKKLRQHVVLVY